MSRRLYRGRHHRRNPLARLLARLRRPRLTTGVVFVPTCIITGYLMIMGGMSVWAFNL